MTLDTTSPILVTKFLSAVCVEQPVDWPDQHILKTSFLTKKIFFTINKLTRGTTATITSAASDDSNVIAATIDGTSAILTITVDGDTNNWLIDIDGNGDVNGHTLIHTHTGGLADVDIIQSGVNDNMITLTTSGDSADIDISQTD